MRDSPYWPVGSWKALRSPSNREMCVCMPEPGWAISGLGMKEAWTLRWMAMFPTMVRIVMTLSAIVRASVYRRSISFCPGPVS